MKHRLGWLLFVGGATSAGLLMMTGGEETKPVVAQSADDSCPATSSPTIQTGTTLETFANDSNSGVVYDSSGTGKLEIQKAGGLFVSTTFSLASDAHGLCTADFDNDGWADIMSTSYSGSDVVLSLNKTIDNQISPAWSNPSYVTTPKFVASYYIAKNCGGENGHPNLSNCSVSGAAFRGNEALACADFDGDGNADFMFVRENNGDNGVPHSATMYLGNGDGTFQLGYQAATPSAFKYINKSTTMLSVDYNNDGNLDLIVGGSSVFEANSKGHVQLFLSDGASPPNFTQSAPLVSNTSFGEVGINTFAFEDFTLDGVKDLLVTSAFKKKISLYPGLSSGGLQATPIDVTNDYPGSAAMVLGADFSLNGQADIMLASDGWGYPGTGNSLTGLGGYTHYYTNNGTANPFSAGIQQTLTAGSPDDDFDMAAVIQYDNDPDGTPDFVVANGNGSNSYQIFANRSIGQYNTCGEVQSGVLSLGVLATQDMVVTAARIAPDMTLPSGTTVVFEMSNELPENWVTATPCTDDPTEFCASFPQPVGRDVKWKATLCANTALTLTPSIEGVEVTFDYTELEEHYRAGVVVDDGVAYVGAFRQPGNSGHFYAINAGFDSTGGGTTYWDFATYMDSVSDSARNIYTAHPDGKTLEAFTVANASNVKNTLGVSGTSQAEAIIGWQRSPRFGVDGSSRLGSIETSTPAVVGAPVIPTWYEEANVADQSTVDSFISTYSTRSKLVYVGSKDGALHAIYNDPTNLSDSKNGTEAWAFIPAFIGNGITADFAATASSSPYKVAATAYPDGSPTVGDVILSDGNIHTVLIAGGGNGSRGIYALDITNTVPGGPEPLWQIIPGGAQAGQALSKPVIARVDISGTSRFIAILATGPAPGFPTKGRDVVGVDINDGTILWTFHAKCPVTSDIVVFETDDETGTAIDGLIDRAVFADECGNVYKVDPGQNPGTDIPGMGTVLTGVASDPIAIFSTAGTTCALGAKRPIYGTIGAGSDASGRLALFFGTGGVESFDPSLNNDFYAVYADNGEIRGCAAGTPGNGRIQGTCNSTGQCQKFYGGVVITASDVITTRATDPVVGTGTCELGSSEVTGFSTAAFVQSFNVSISSSSVSSLYGTSGALYLSTVGGDIVRIGTAGAANAGDVSAAAAAASSSSSGAGYGAGTGGLHIQSWNMLK